jgi:hypothetical protein
VEDMCYERRRAEACVDESAHHALANAGGREIVGKKEGEQKGSVRGSVHWGCYYATLLFRVFITTPTLKDLQSENVCVCVCVFLCFCFM